MQLYPPVSRSPRTWSSDIFTWKFRKGCPPREIIQRSTSPDQLTKIRSAFYVLTFLRKVSNFGKLLNVNGSSLRLHAESRLKARCFCLHSKNQQVIGSKTIYTRSSVVCSFVAASSVIIGPRSGVSLLWTISENLWKHNSREILFAHTSFPILFTIISWW